MKKIVISNIYGPHNLGDWAIRDSAMRLIKEAIPESRFFLLCESTSAESITQYKNKESELEYNPYGYMIHSKTGERQNFLVKLSRFFYILTFSILFAILGKL